MAKEPNGSGPCFLGSPWQQLLHEGGHSDNRSEERNTLRLTRPIDSWHDELSLMCEKGEQYTDCKGQEMKVSACTQGMGSKPLNQLCRNFTVTGGQPARRLATNG